MFVRLSLVLCVMCCIGCTALRDVPTEFPTPDPPPAATPVPKLDRKPDAELEKQFAKIAEEAKGEVGVMAVVLETGESAGLNSDQHFPMQSVYKLPICMAVMDQVRLGKIDLDEVIGVSKEDMVREGQASALRDKNPDGGEFTIRELIRMALVESDGTASDVLLRVVGGPDEVQAYLTQIGVRDIKVLNSEKEMGRDWATQYQNWATPQASIELLIWIFNSGGILSRAAEPNEPLYNLLLVNMNDSVPGQKRIKGMMPAVIVPHKTGTGGVRNGLTSATNDIGLIYLPSNRHIAVAVFIADSSSDLKTREAAIAKIVKAAYDRWSK